MTNLAQHTAIVTGAGVRLGRALAIALAGAGAQVVVHYGTSSEAAAETVNAIRQRGGNAVAVQANLRDAVAAAERLVEQATQQLAPPTILVNSAAIFEEGGPIDSDEATWDAHFSINLKAPFFLCQAFAANLPDDASGHILNIADWRTLRPRGDKLVYTLTKSALVTMTLGLAHALAPQVQVNAIAPGAILPPPDGNQESFKQLARQIPLRRTGNPDEVCEAALYLLGSRFVTGEVLYLTGGEHL